MKIGIIGVGNIGGALARKLIAVGHQVIVANSRGIEGVRSIAESIGATPSDLNGAVEAVDVVILSIPFHKVADLPNGLLNRTPAHVPVVDTSNYYPGLLNPEIEAVDAGMTESVWVSQHLGRRVIKAFNNIVAPSLAQPGQPPGSADRVAIAVAGDDAEQKRKVMDLVDAIGFDPVDGGTLDESWRQEPATPSYCGDYSAADMRRGLKQAVKGEGREKLKQLPGMLGALGPSPSHEDIIKMNRQINPLK